MNVSTLKKGLSSHRHTKLIFKDVVAADRLEQPRLVETRLLHHWSGREEGALEGDPLHA